MIIMVAFLFVYAPLSRRIDPTWFLGLYFLSGLLVMALLTRLICHRAVICPWCGSSLWDCGTGNFKPRRLTLKRNVKACPSCGADIIGRSSSG